MKTNILKMIEQAVEWQTLGEVAIIKTGQPISKNKIANNEGVYPVINSGREPLGFINEWNTENDPIGITTRGAGVGSVTWQEKKYFRGNLNYSVTIKDNSKLMVRFLYHILLEYEKQIHELCTFTGIPALNASNLRNLKIPIPPLSVQSQIVQILDAFTELTEQLTAELSMRQKQYQYYRDFLLSEHELAKVRFEWKTLGKLGIINRGKRVVKSQLTTEGVYPVYQNSLQPLGYFDKSNVKANTTFMITAGAAGEIGYSNCAFWSADDCYYFDCPKDVLDDRFLYHSLKKQQNKIFSQVRKASIPRLGRNSVENIKIPIPPLSVQSQIVAILDTFDTLTQSISEGLPKEIQLRQKQYEYYRERLLNFDAGDAS
ncbi:restriction endonuclease subunit S [Moraxella catarrhalis]|uniref:restriction endonuclease subunit S n=1 Tax=Moraxella catarrhalis TaxID=480 RepID=UPI000EAAB174|nr:restriction endonuclease subunit S [Moraxella catarrhalis]RKM34171.1 restriction endonuclease subunit S [Moraxella catarrhalis]